MKVKNIQTVLILLLSALFLSQCAKIVAPTGGPKDEDHPLIVKIEPPFNTTNFDKKKIEITFNEFIQLKDLNSNLVVSPPLEEKPEIKIKGKSLIIELLGELQDSTTYNIYFGNSVQDFNEGNPVENFEYVFSTGDFIDSLSIKGQIVNAFNLLPEEGVYVMLYKDYEDSVPIKQLPVHISKTNDEGFFQINNISYDKFKLFCLRDFNKNYLFDLPNEDIAFIDSLVTFKLVTETTIDTIFKSDSIIALSDSVFVDSLDFNKNSIDSLNSKEQFNKDSISITDSLRGNNQDEIDTLTIKKDSVDDALENSLADSISFNEKKTDSLTIKQQCNEDSLSMLDSSWAVNRDDIDSIIIKSRTFFPVDEYIFRMFTEYHEVQYLTNNERKTRQKIEINFNKPIKDSVLFTVADTVINHKWFLKEVNQYNDSIIYWLTDSTIYNKESISFGLTYQKEDSNMVYQWGTDTLRLRYTEPKLKKNETVDTSLKYQLNLKSRGTIDLNKPVNFLFETPIDKYDTSKIRLYAIVDSLEIPVDFSFEQDSLKQRKFSMGVDWCSDSIYRIEIYPKAFKDIYGAVNDTNILEFKTQARDYYGKILANVTGIDSSLTSFQVIAQLILPSKDKETIIRENIIKNDQIIVFDYLPPKELIFKVIIDKNFNGKWDTGEYMKHIQPEEVLYYKDKIKVRSNWDIEISFDVNKE